MTHLKELLARGADVPVGLPDVPTIWGQARTIRRRRAALAITAAAVVLTAGTLGALDARGAPDRDPPVVEPAPVLSLPDRPGPLEVDGTYGAEVAGREVRFTLPGEEWVLATSEPDWVSLHQGRLRVNLQRWSGVYDPESDPPSASAVQPMPADLREWLHQHPSLQVTEEGSIDLLGGRWSVLDVRVTKPLAASVPECGGRPCVVLAAVGPEQVEVLAAERARIYVAPPGVGLVLVAAAPARTLDLTVVEALATSLKAN